MDQLAPAQVGDGFLDPRSEVPKSNTKVTVLVWRVSVQVESSQRFPQDFVIDDKI